MANNNPTVHTVPNGSEWKNVQDGKTIDLYETKGLAVEAGREKAKNDETEHVIHNLNGKISESNSYGNDPFPPRG